ncbi:uncharacterized protein LOC119678974 [Teleopsis dalmanni]|uniref:uncharacterized protein LOC119678974 n=1 Tax=Teleopsis dalmanni TaxID=139649 RepID=UPI0018CE089C|nr:uncharacterized protein LOC119678974 [Teleopsis dalmanni]
MADSENFECDYEEITITFHKKKGRRKVEDGKSKQSTTKHLTSQDQEVTKSDEHIKLRCMHPTTTNLKEKEVALDKSLRRKSTFNGEEQEIGKPLLGTKNKLLRISEVYEHLENLSATLKCVKDIKQSKNLECMPIEKEEQLEVKKEVSQEKVVQTSKQTPKGNVLPIIGEVKKNLANLNKSQETNTIQDKNKIKNNKFLDIVSNLRNEFLLYQRCLGTNINTKESEQHFCKINKAKQCILSTVAEKSIEKNKCRKSDISSVNVKKLNVVNSKISTNVKTQKFCKKCGKNRNIPINQNVTTTTPNHKKYMENSTQTKQTESKIFVGPSSKSQKNCMEIAHKDEIKRDEVEQKAYYTDNDSSTHTEEAELEEYHNNSHNNSPTMTDSVKYLVEIGLEEYLKRLRNGQQVPKINETISTTSPNDNDHDVNMVDDFKVKKEPCSVKIDCQTQTSVCSIFPKLERKIKSKTNHISPKVRSLFGTRGKTTEGLSIQKNNKMNSCMKLMEYSSSSETESDYSVRSIEWSIPAEGRTNPRYASEATKKNTQMEFSTKEVQTAHSHACIYLDLDGECESCKNGCRPIYKKHILAIIYYMIRGYNPNDVALIINATKPKIFHFKMIAMSTGETLNCFFTTSNGLERAKNEGVMKYFLVYFKPE